MFRVLCVAAPLLVSCALGTARVCVAAERVQLRNGFNLECERREVLKDGHVRLFTDATGTNYMDVEAASIASVEPSAPPAQHRAGTSAAGAERPSTDLGATERPLASLIAAAGTAHNINVALLQSVVNAESGGHAHAVSRTGAQGLMQLMPGTARSLGVQNSFEPEENLRGGTTYLDRLLVRYHDNMVLALAAYNAGPAAVDRYHGVPPYRETVAYVSRIVREFNRRTLEEQKTLARGRNALAESLPTP